MITSVRWGPRGRLAAAVVGSGAIAGSIRTLAPSAYCFALRAARSGRGWHLFAVVLAPPDGLGACVASSGRGSAAVGLEDEGRLFGRLRRGIGRSRTGSRRRRARLRAWPGRCHSPELWGWRDRSRPACRFRARRFCSAGLDGEFGMGDHQSLVAEDGDARDGVHVLLVQEVDELGDVVNVDVVLADERVLEGDGDAAVGVFDVEDYALPPTSRQWRMMRSPWSLAAMMPVR